MEIVEQKKAGKSVSRNSICFITNGRVTNIELNEVVCIYRRAYETEIITTRSHYKIKRYKNIINELPENLFVQVSKSHIISMKDISAIQGNEVFLRGLCIKLTKHFRNKLMIKLREILDKGYHHLISKE